ncbi:hypothetical protein QFW77_02360 [Luteimonas sp. RD2P54]|uniref:Uncharacterized protein n=1 Tax=Luteimonas endophytica TaxID=3042023 RepID=A0ABT6J4U0_9GAMM|nr:hypothetical protein [Luteimonas endophytica]MDH5821838.1 hypothetical protein [Luteimonas endophytica]
MERSPRHEAVDPGHPESADAHEEAFPDMRRYQREFRDAPSYSAGRTWSDYAPAYRYGRLQHGAEAGKPFERVEAVLARGWRGARGGSRLNWTEARPAVMVAWNDALAEARRG